MWLYPVLFFSPPLSLLFHVRPRPTNHSLPLLDNQLQVELSFKTGEVILVYGDMDEDGFYMGEVDGVRGLVPSNFLTESPGTNVTPGATGPGVVGVGGVVDPYGNSAAGRAGGPVANNRNGRIMGSGGAGGMNAPRGPQPPNMGGMMGGPNQRAQPGIRKGMWPVERRCVNPSPPNTQFSFRAQSDCH